MSAKDKAARERKRRERVDHLIAEGLAGATFPVLAYPNTTMHSIVVYVMQHHPREFAAWLNQEAGEDEDDPQLTVQEVKRLLYSMHELTHIASDMEIMEDMSRNMSPGDLLVFQMPKPPNAPHDDVPGPYL